MGLKSLEKPLKRISLIPAPIFHPQHPLIPNAGMGRKPNLRRKGIKPLIKN